VSDRGKRGKRGSMSAHVACVWTGTLGGPGQPDQPASQSVSTEQQVTTRLEEEQGSLLDERRAASRHTMTQLASSLLLFCFALLCFTLHSWASCVPAQRRRGVDIMCMFGDMCVRVHERERERQRQRQREREGAVGMVVFYGIRMYPERSHHRFAGCPSRLWGLVVARE